MQTPKHGLGFPTCLLWQTRVAFYKHGRWRKGTVQQRCKRGREMKIDNAGRHIWIKGEGTRGRKSWLWGCWQAAVWETEQIKPGEVSKGERVGGSEQSVRDRKDEEIQRRDTGKKNKNKITLEGFSEILHDVRSTRDKMLEADPKWERGVTIHHGVEKRHCTLDNERYASTTKPSFLMFLMSKISILSKY